MKKYSLYLVVAFLGFVLNACVYDFVAPEEVPDIPVDEDISFSTEVLPIFTSQCASCHKPGGQSPYLTSGSAYQSINTSKYIDTDSPESSLIYSFVEPNATSHTWKHYSAAQAQFVLVWIEQGAQDN